MREANQYQQTGAWFNDRVGKLTASRMAAAMNFLKAKGNEEPKDGADRKKLKIEILTERLTDNIVKKYVTMDMQWGLDQEAPAKDAITQKTGWVIEDLGFIEHPNIENCGCSPDGYLPSEHALIEIKCPSSLTYISWLSAASKDPNWLPEEYIPQMTLQSACFAGIPVWFCAYDPRIKYEDKRLLLRKFTPTLDQLQEVEQMAKRFLAEVEIMFDEIIKGA